MVEFQHTFSANGSVDFELPGGVFALQGVCGTWNGSSLSLDSSLSGAEGEFGAVTQPPAHTAPVAITANAEPLILPGGNTIRVTLASYGGTPVKVLVSRCEF